MMMRKKTKMAWSVALSAAMAAGLLAGCGSNGGAESTSGSTAASSAKTESSAGDTADTSDRPTYKIATVRWTDTWPTDFLHGRRHERNRGQDEYQHRLAGLLQQ